MCLLNYLKIKNIYIAMLMRKLFSNLFHAKFLRFNPKLNRSVRLNVIHVTGITKQIKTRQFKTRQFKTRQFTLGCCYFSPKTTVHKTKTSHCNSAMQRKVLSQASFSAGCVIFILFTFFFFSEVKAPFSILMSAFTKLKKISHAYTHQCTHHSNIYIYTSQFIQQKIFFNSTNNIDRWIDRI